MIIAQAEVEDVKFRIFRPDDHNYTVDRWIPPHIGVRGKGVGKMVSGKWDICGYYPTPQRAAKAIIKHGVATIPQSFQEIISILNELEERFEKKFQ